jgi:selenocysteine-specific elongation factor
VIIIGTAGHIDHGKSSLVRALTGITTDRLKEEKARGISIELGFAYVDLPDGQRCGLIDVPGHERFVRHMIAGASGIDLVVLVVAADEGVMQQTREHLDICALLGITRGIVALTKVDLVDDEWLDLVESDLEDSLAGTFLDRAPIIRFSAIDESTHAGMRDALFNAVGSIKQDAQAERTDSPTRLPIDRVFTIRGFGTVVTGTLSSGLVSTGDAVEIQPSMKRAKVRGIESHGSTVKNASRGQRVAINLSGVDVDDISRGDVLTHAGVLQPSRMLDIDLHLLPQAPRAFEGQIKVLVHVGTAQVNGTVVLLDRDTLEPGDTAPAQLRLDRWVVALGGDRVVLRGFEMLPQHGKTLGGGIIRHPVAPKHRRSDREQVIRAFNAWRSDNKNEAIQQTLALAGQNGATMGLIRQVHSLTEQEASHMLQTLITSGSVYQYVQDGSPMYVDRSHFGVLADRASSKLSEYHSMHPHRPGMPREELRSQIRRDLPARYFGAILEHLVASSKATVSERFVKEVNFVPRLNDDLKKVQEVLLDSLDSFGLEPPAPADIREDVASRAGSTTEAVDEIIDLLVDQGKIARILDKLLFSSKHIDSLEQKVVDFLTQNGEMTTPQLKLITGASRKYTVPLGEYLDSKRITIRVGDARKLRGG